MKKKRIIIGAVILLAVAVSLVVIIRKSKAEKPESKESSAIQISPVNTDSSENTAVSASSTESNMEITSSSTDENNDSEIQISPAAEEQNGSASGGNQSVPSAHAVSPGEQGLIVSGGTSKISFPFTDKENNLRIDAIYNYEGIYLEDGSDQEIGSVAMIQLTNISEQPIEYGSVRMTGGGTDLKFSFSLVPAGASVLVMDANRTAFDEASSCTYEGAEVAYTEAFSRCEDQVSIDISDSGAVTVQNISASDIPELRLFYKNKMDTGEYIGGIAYTAKIENLASGASTVINPTHLDPQFGEIMMVRTYEENTDQ